MLDVSNVLSFNNIRMVNTDVRSPMRCNIELCYCYHYSKFISDPSYQVIQMSFLCYCYPSYQVIQICTYLELEFPKLNYVYCTGFM